MNLREWHFVYEWRWVINNENVHFGDFDFRPPAVVMLKFHVFFFLQGIGMLAPLGITLELCGRDFNYDYKWINKI